MTDRKKSIENVMFAIALGVLLAGSTIVVASAMQPTGGAHKVTICHATGSQSNPYVQITVDAASILQGGHGGHPHDIIPPFTLGSVHYPGKNWDAQGQAIYFNNCKVPTETSPTPSPTGTPATTPTPTPETSPTPTVSPSTSPTPTPASSPSPSSPPSPSPSAGGAGVASNPSPPSSSPPGEELANTGETPVGLFVAGGLGVIGLLCIVAGAVMLNRRRST